jgi:uncharacterized RDD family membrane protein YckC
MSEDQKISLMFRYRDMSTDELVDIRRKGTLTDEANQAMEKVLNERGVTTQEIIVIEDELDVIHNERLASLGNRFLAQVIDNIIALLFCLILYLVGNLFTSAHWFAFVGYLSYYLLSDGLRGGQSFGKRAYKIAVINIKNGKPCGFGRSVVSNISLLLLGPIDALFVFGKSRRRLGDFAADTEVINVKSNIVAY